MNELLRRLLGIQKERVLAQRSAICSPHHAVRNGRRRFHQESEIIRHLLGEVPVLSNGERPVVRAIHTDRPKQRMTAVSSQTFICQILNAAVAAPDNSFPSGESP